jgi:beta-xylosidase
MNSILFKKISTFLNVIFFLFVFSSFLYGQTTEKNESGIKNIKGTGAVWIPDNGDGTYKNPIIYADYSDPDVCRVGDDFYMTSSSFSNFPGLPILHSKDLVNWKIIGHAVIEYPIKGFDKTQHGNGIWAPSIRYHNGEFYIYFGDPDYGIFITKTKNPAGTWEPLKLIHKAKGWIDPCPLWDDDDNAYLVHAWAKSRSGIKHKLTVNKLSADGTEILDEGTTVFMDSAKHPTMEGPKFYKRNGYYYIFAPAGGVKPGWQVVLRSKSVYGPYEDKIVLEQGSTNINGPHQGGWVQTQTGEDWFVHFQDRYAYGRIVHLQPMHWENGWPVIGEDYDKNGIGEPVMESNKPNIGNTLNIEVPQTNDEFDPPDGEAGSSKLGLQWQWEANFKHDWISLKERNGWLRLYSQFPVEGFKNLWDVPCILTQKFPAPKFTTTTKIEFSPKHIGEKTGLIIFGSDYSYISIEKTESGYKISQIVCINADKGSEEKTIKSVNLENSKIFFRADIKPENETDIIPKIICNFSYSEEGKTFYQIGKEFVAKEGRWVGAKIGIFAVTPAKCKDGGYADFDWVNFK